MLCTLVDKMNPQISTLLYIAKTYNMLIAYSCVYTVSLLHVFKLQDRINTKIKNTHSWSSILLKGLTIPEYIYFCILYHYFLLILIWTRVIALVIVAVKAEVDG